MSGTLHMTSRRKSFTSNAYKAKMSVKSIMQITGHKKTETFFAYVSLSEEEHAELISERRVA